MVRAPPIARSISQLVGELHRCRYNSRRAEGVYPRSVTVIARQDCELAFMRRDKLGQLLQQFPSFREQLQRFAARRLL